MYRRSLAVSGRFWGEVAAAIDLDRPYDQAFAGGLEKAPDCSRFPGGTLNTCHNALDRHVNQGRGYDDALIFGGAVSGTAERFTFRRLRDDVAGCADSLGALAVERSDRVVIYMSMVPETATAMLAWARLGAVHSVVFGGIAPRELAVLIDDATPTVVDLPTKALGTWFSEGNR